MLPLGQNPAEGNYRDGRSILVLLESLVTSGVSQAKDINRTTVT